MKKTKPGFVSTISQRVEEILEIFLYPPQTILSNWFENLWQILEEKDSQDLVRHGIWYQTETGLRFNVNSEQWRQPIYRVRILQLPKVKHNRKTYQPEISETTFVWGIFPKTAPEIQGWNLILSIKPSSRKQSIPSVEFIKTQKNTLKSIPFYQIRYKDGKDLTFADVKLFKSIFDASISKMKKGTDSKIH